MTQANTNKLPKTGYPAILYWSNTTAPPNGLVTNEICEPVKTTNRAANIGKMICDHAGKSYLSSRTPAKNYDCSADYYPDNLEKIQFVRPARKRQNQNPESKSEENGKPPKFRTRLVVDLPLEVRQVVDLQVFR